MKEINKKYRPYPQQQKPTVSQKKISVQLTAEEAEEILIAISHRKAEKRIAAEQRQQLTDLGRKLSTVFEKTFKATEGWFDRIDSRRRFEQSDISYHKQPADAFEQERATLREALQNIKSIETQLGIKLVSKN